jgi:hypothetical protein
MADAIDKLTSQLAKRGYVTRRRLLLGGIPAKTIDYRVKVGRLIPVYAAVYAVGHVPTLPQDRAYGALLACGPRAVLSHRSAASLWGIFRSWDMPFEVTTPTKRVRPGIRTHRAKLTPADWCVEAGIRVTSPARTCLDIATIVRERTLTRAVNDLLAHPHMSVEHLRDVLERFPRHPGAARLRPFAERTSGFTRSDLEDRFVAFCERFGLPTPKTNIWVAGREADAFFEQERLIVELDSEQFHASRSRFRSDRDKDANALAVDLPTLRITDDRLSEAPEREAERLHAILAMRRRRVA